MYNIVDKNGFYIQTPRTTNAIVTQDDFLKCKLVAGSHLATRFTFEDAVTYQAGLHRLTAWQLSLVKVSIRDDDKAKVE